MATTTNLALPYPANTDYVAQGYAQIQNLATAIDAYFGAWTVFTGATAGVAFGNVTGGTVSGRYKVLGKLAFVDYTINAGTATAAGSCYMDLPTAIAVNAAAYPLPVKALIAVGGLTYTTTSARLESSARRITYWASTTGTNFTVGQAATGTFSIIYETA